MEEGRGWGAWEEMEREEEKGLGAWVAKGREEGEARVVVG